MRASADGLVLKPVTGSNSRGLLVLSLAATHPFAPLPLASGQPRKQEQEIAGDRSLPAEHLREIEDLPQEIAGDRCLPAEHLWVFAPVKGVKTTEVRTLTPPHTHSLTLTSAPPTPTPTP